MVTGSGFVTSPVYFEKGSIGLHDVTLKPLVLVVFSVFTNLYGVVVFLSPAIIHVKDDFSFFFIIVLDSVTVDSLLTILLPVTRDDFISDGCICFVEAISCRGSRSRLRRVCDVSTGIGVGFRPFLLVAISRYPPFTDDGVGVVNLQERTLQERSVVASLPLQITSVSIELHQGRLVSDRSFVDTSF